MSGVCAAAGARQVPDPKRVAAWERPRDFAGCALNGADQRRGPKARRLSRSNATVVFATIRQRDRIAKVSPLGRSDGDRLPRRERLGCARADRSDCEYREKPNHSKRMIAHASA